MSAVMNHVMAWLVEFDGVSGVQRVTPDIIEGDDASISDLPQDNVEVYINGDRDITSYVMFRIRHGVKTHGERIEAQEMLSSFENEVWQKNLARDLPVGDKNIEFQRVSISESPYMLETDGDDAVFQLSLEVNYIDRNGGK